MKIKSIKQLKKIEGKKILLRADLNAPLEKGEVAEDFKIIKSLETIEYLSSKKAKVVVCSHLGRPEGKEDLKFSLAPVAYYLEKKLKKKVVFLEEKIGSKALEEKIKKLEEGDIAVLQNLRFYKGEKEDKKTFAQKLAKNMDLYVNDAFGVCHRKHASVSQIKSFLKPYAGFLLEKEIKNLQTALHSKKPLVLILGGAKIKTKAPLLEKFITKSQFVLLGGALANNFLKAFNYEIGQSLTDKESVDWAKKFIKNKNYSKKIVLPEDCLVENKNKIKLKNINKIAKTDKILDIGPQTINSFSQIIKGAKTLIWNGPMGKFEDTRFKQGSMSIARTIGLQSLEDSYTLIGGGETVQIAVKAQVEKDINWVSTGGGATLTYLSGQKMPGLSKIIT